MSAGTCMVMVNIFGLPVERSNYWGPKNVESQDSAFGAFHSDSASKPLKYLIRK